MLAGQNASGGFQAKRSALAGILPVSDKAVKKAFLSVKRELFFPESLRSFSYEDNAFPIGSGQTISQPSTIAIMLEMLSPKQGQKVLEVGSGSGYVAALLSSIVGSKGMVFGVERVEELREIALKALALQGCTNVQLAFGNGRLGLEKKAPFDRILVSAACASVPEPLFRQLAPRGRLVAPVGNRFLQDLVLFEKRKSAIVETDRKTGFAFVPLK